jgi:hypothetical protein
MIVQRSVGVLSSKTPIGCTYCTNVYVVLSTTRGVSHDVVRCECHVHHAGLVVRDAVPYTYDVPLKVPPYASSNPDTWSAGRALLEVATGMGNHNACHQRSRKYRATYSKNCMQIIDYESFRCTTSGCSL